MKRLSLIGVLTLALLPLGCARNYSSNNYNANPNYYPHNSTYRTTYYVPSSRSHHHHHHHDGGGGGHHDGGHHGGGHH